MIIYCGRGRTHSISNPKPTTLNILIVGGCGYLGQHLLQGLSKNPSFDLAITYHFQPLRGSRSDPSEELLNITGLSAYPVDLKSGRGLKVIHDSTYDEESSLESGRSKDMQKPHIVINCAALSVPGACEADPADAMSTNVPSSLVCWLSRFEGRSPLLIHLSTDQVYEGVKSFYKEADETKPVNVYGRSKVAAEQHIFNNYSNFAILRSSIIYGPQTPSPVRKSLPIQWIDDALSKGSDVEFFQDEFRCPVYVKDVVAVVEAVISKWISDGENIQLLLNVGGPDRVSRVQMAETVAHFRGYNPSLIKPVPASWANRGFMSPADISMDISKVVRLLHVSPTPFAEGVRLTLQTQIPS